jgi:hypothetical protein
MGVTIHFEGHVKGPIRYSLLIDELREFAASRGWKCDLQGDSAETRRFGAPGGRALPLGS